ncbi:acetyltransferase EpsM [Flavobacterium sp. 28A]|uniref:acetyltransferase n=1 Tax=Flavobacterium sp. 28A TaxID=2735895 RepID=UPI001C2DC635|nr:acetyltransferase [Flavobacterium sp. 28A]NRT15116.1 acetyltransferase EpsM [Flavobacterium sp. 28A]
MENKIYLYGASGHCKVVMTILLANQEKITAIIDDNPKTKELLAVPVIHSTEFVAENNQKLIVSIGNNEIRKKIVNKIKGNFHTAIHPKAIVSLFSKVKEGSMVMAGAIINVDAVVGKHCIVNTGAIIEHDCVIEDYVHLSPNATLSGNVVVKEGAHIGVGACVIQGVTIGKWAIIGAGTVIIRDVPDYAVVVGNPGRVIKSKKIIDNE